MKIIYYTLGGCLRAWKKNKPVGKTLLIVIAGILFAVDAGKNPNKHRYSQMYNMSDIGVIFLVSFVIGNTVAWSMGAYPRDFERIDYSEDDQAAAAEFEEYLGETPDDDVILTEYGALLSAHNRLDKAEDTLESAVGINPDNNLAGAWLAINQLKQAGASIDLTFGLMKIYKIGNVETSLNKLVKKEPSNALIRIIRLHAFVGAHKKIDGFKTLCGEETHLESALKNELKEAAALALANYYSKNPPCRASQKNLNLAKTYLDMTGTFNSVSYGKIKTAIQTRINAFKHE